MVVSYIVVFTCIWWIIFFITLPFGVKTIDSSKRGFDSGAPKNPRIGLKMLITTLITSFLTIGVIYAIECGYINNFVNNYIELFSIKI